MFTYDYRNSVEVWKTSAVQIDDILVTRQKAVYDTNGERFPVKIAFTRELNDKQLQQLAVLAKWIQDREEGEQDELRGDV